MIIINLDGETYKRKKLKAISLKVKLNIIYNLNFRKILIYICGINYIKITENVSYVVEATLKFSFPDQSVNNATWKVVAIPEAKLYALQVSR